MTATDTPRLTDDEVRPILERIIAGSTGWQPEQVAEWKRRIQHQPQITVDSGMMAAEILVDSWTHPGHPGYGMFVTAHQSALRQIAAAPEHNPTHSERGIVKDPARRMILAAAALLMGDVAFWDRQGWPKHDHSKGGTAVVEVHDGATTRRRPLSRTSCPRCGEDALERRWDVAVLTAEERWKAGELAKPSDVTQGVSIGHPGAMEPTPITDDLIEQGRARFKRAMGLT